MGTKSVKKCDCSGYILIVEEHNYFDFEMPELKQTVGRGSSDA